MAATNRDLHSKTVEVLESRNPATGEVIGSVPVLGEKEIATLVERARVAAAVWGQLSFKRRREELIRFRRALAGRAEELAELIHRENGKHLVEAMSEVMLAVSHLDHAAKRAPVALATQKVPVGMMPNFRATVSYVPLGVVGVIGPWNFPLYTPMGSISYALAAGNAVVFKPSELTPLVGQFLVDVAHQSLSIPDVLLLATGDGRTGAALARSGVNKIAFTGSTPTGRKVMQAAAERLTPVVLELGGKDPMIVADDADIDKAAEAAVFGSMHNSGQACTSVERCYVVASVYDRFVDKVTEEIQFVTGAGEDARYGAITMPRQVEIIREHLEDAIAKGARVITGGPDKIHKNFVEPTILVDVTSDMKIMTEETFGPVLPIARVESVEDAVVAANDSPYGLASSVFGKRGIQALAGRIKAGVTTINSVLAFGAIPSLPFGGTGESGFGRIHGDEGLREFARTKSTAEERFALPLNLLSFRWPKDIYGSLHGMIDRLYGGGFIDRATDKLGQLRH